MYEDYDDYPMSEDSEKVTGEITRKTVMDFGRTRHVVDHQPADIKKPSLREGVPFAQSMCKLGY